MTSAARVAGWILDHARSVGSAVKGVGALFVAGWSMLLKKRVRGKRCDW